MYLESSTTIKMGCERNFDLCRKINWVCVQITLLYDSVG